MIETNSRGSARVRRLSRRRVVQGGAALLGLGLAGCTTTSETPTAQLAPTTGPAASPTARAGAQPAATAAPRPKAGGVLRTMATAGEPNLEPHTTGIASGVGASICYSTLLTYKWGPDIKPPSYIPTGDLAESWTQPDDLTYVFKLRPGVKWHNIAPVNGRDLVAEDIVYSYERVREKRSYAGFLAGITRMEAVDRSTLRLTLDKPNADLLNNLAQNTLLIVARERVEQTGGNLNDPPLIGTGPFLLDAFEPGQRTVVKRNPDYFLRGQPYVDTYEKLQVTGDPSLMINSFRAGATNILGSGLTLQAAEDIKRTVPSAVVIFVPADRVPTDLILNLGLDLFRDVRVRQAISKAIDRKAIVDAVWVGRGGYLGGLSLPEPSYGLPDAELGRLVGRDVEGARRLLQQAGVSNLSFEIMVSNVLSGAIVSMAELIQANLRDIGITTTLRTVDTAATTAALQSGSFQAVANVASSGAPNGWLYGRHYSAGPTNYAKYSDPEMDRLIDQQAVMARDPEGRKRILQDVQRKIINDAAYIPIVLFETPLVHAAEVKDFHPPTILNSQNLFWTSVWLDK
jgi:peptide/nickel transport system substrate-binding protein